MPNVDVSISCAVGGAPATISLTVTVSKENLDIFFPSTSDGWGYWPRRDEAESLIYSILKEELFQDEVTPIQNEDDLRRIGVTHLSVRFDSEDVGHSMGTTIIEHT